MEIQFDTSKENSFSEEGKAIAEQVKEIIKTVVERMKDATEEEKQAHANVLYKVYLFGESPKQAMGISDQRMEELYNDGYTLFKAGKYNDSATIFRMLSMYNPRDTRFSLALGASYQRMKDYDKAIQAYVMCAYVDKESPLPLYYSSDCYMKMNNPIASLTMLSATLTRCKDKPLYNAIRETSLIMYNNLCKQLNVPSNFPLPEDK